MYQAERGLFELQRGRVICVEADAESNGGSRVLAAAVEGLTTETLNLLQRAGSWDIGLVITGKRAQVLGLADGAHVHVGRCLPLPVRTRPETILELAAAASGVFPSAEHVRGASDAEMASLALARLARLLPAVVTTKVAEADLDADEMIARGDALLVRTSEIASMSADDHFEVTHATEGPVPLADAEDARFISFREGRGMQEHVAILTGDRENWPDPVPVRLHSACLTGDLFGSLRCDCGEQLRGSLQVFSSRGGGVLLYLSQEGRGIGLANKLRAYSLQQRGLDTVDADCTLGFGADERRYDAAVEMLRYLEIERVQLLTNNPEKVRALREGGIEVIDRQPLYGTLNRHNVRYVTAKVQRAGHWLGEMLSGAVTGK